ncbi:MAG UNVERIFIED_CONTAM: hypothetical protein LVQ98_07345 [Rickettsiaceae bacterium]|jgi:putative ABC transport system permease protein
MFDFMDLMEPSFLQGLVLSLVALGIMIPFKMLNFPDLTAEGSYPLGGAICASLILLEIHPGIATILAFVMAGIAGILSAILYLRLRINTLLAGIIVSTMIYSLNLRIMGKPNLALFEIDHLFSAIADNIYLKMLVLLGVNMIIILPLIVFFYTEKGLVIRAVGANPKFVERIGINPSICTILGLFIGNGLCGMAGAIMVQMQGYMDIAMGVGIVVHALAALMIGEALIKTDSTIKQIIAPFIGALVYQQIQGIAMAIGFAASDLKFLTGFIVLFIFFLQKPIMP